MKCPKCQAENNAGARFCVRCGYNFSAAGQTSGGSGMQGAVNCTKCGRVLPAGVRFCMGCGNPVGNVPAQRQMPEDDSDGTMILGAEDDSDGTMILGMENDSDGTAILGDTGMPYAGNAGGAAGTPYGQSDETTMLQDGGTYTPGGAGHTATNNGYNNRNATQGGNKPVQPAQPVQGRSGNAGLIVVISVLCALIAVVAVVLILVWKNVIELPFSLPFLNRTTQTAEADEDEEESTEDSSDKGAKGGVSEKQLSEADEILSSGKKKAEDAEGLFDGMNAILAAMDEYKSLAAEYGMSDAVSERMTDAYDAYASAVIKHKDMLVGQGLSGGIYTQVMSEFDQADSYAQGLGDAGFSVETSLLASEMEAFDTNYRSRLIKTFNEFTSRTDWSRTEAWNLMDDTDSMFSADDLDDPIRLRYCYALAWWTQKQIETELSSGIITPKGAAAKIAGLIEATDYNLILIDLYISYMKAEGQECQAVMDAYADVLLRLKDTQGIRIGVDIDLAHFWYFNDFGEYSVDDKNGVTPENRQWIRERMRSVTF